MVRKGLQSKKAEQTASFTSDMKDGIRAVTEKKGVLVLVVMGSLITTSLGFIQTLASPLVLSFESSATLGTLMSVIALGMLASSMLLGGISIKCGYVKLLCCSLFGAGKGRGIGLLIALAGLLLCGTAILLFGMKSIQGLENRETYEI